MEEMAYRYESRKLLKQGQIKAAQLSKLKTGALISKDPVYIGYSKTARQNGFTASQFEFMQALDSQIYRMLRSGEIDKILEAYDY